MRRLEPEEQLRFTMQDAEDLVCFWMNSHFDREGFSQDVMLDWLTRINGLERGDPRVLFDFQVWVTKTKAKIAEREKT